MSTELYPYTITYSTGFFRIFEATNNNLLIQSPLAQDVITVDPSTSNIFYFGTSENRIALDYTLCTNLVNTTRQVLIDNIIALAATTNTVIVNQGTSPWVTSSATTPSAPSASDIIGASRTTTGTLVTIPANRVFYGQVSLSGSISVAGNCQPTISVSAVGSGVSPIGTIHQIGVTGLALVAVANANTMGNVYIHGGTAGATVTFTAGSSGNSSGQITGRLL